MDINANTALADEASAEKPKRPKRRPAAGNSTQKRKAGGNGNKPRNKGGRPKALVADEKTLRQLRTLAAIQCTQKEAAGVLGVSENSLCTFLGPTGSKIARESWEAGRQNGRASIRRKQYEMALRGNITMLIWWGKNNLGQSDKLERTDTVDANISTTSVAVLTAPDLEGFDDKKVALRQFEEFRLRLAKQPKIIDAEPVPAAA
jgi:hypothetical protein